VIITSIDRKVGRGELLGDKCKLLHSMVLLAESFRMSFKKDSLCIISAIATGSTSSLCQRLWHERRGFREKVISSEDSSSSVVVSRD